MVYTPTGSNAFAHSAGARKLRADDGRIGVIALAPYSGLLKKGGVLVKKGAVGMRLLCRTGEVSIDGSETFLRKVREGDHVLVERSERPLRLIGFSRTF